MEKGQGKVATIISLPEGKVYCHVFKNPSIFTFENDAGEILNWHKENVLSLISRFDINYIVVKKTERKSSQYNKMISDNSILKLYIEGLFLSLAGSLGMSNKHYYKKEILKELGKYAYDQELEDLINAFGKTLDVTSLKATEKDPVKELFLTVMTLERTLLSI